MNLFMIYADTIVTIDRDRKEIRDIVDKIDDMTKERTSLMKKIRQKQYQDKQYQDKQERDLMKRDVVILALTIRHHRGYLYIAELK